MEHNSAESALFATQKKTILLTVRDGAEIARQLPAAADGPVGDLPLSAQLVSCVRSLADVCSEHSLNEVEVAWIQTSAPPPIWSSGQEVQGLKLKVTRDSFHLEGQLTEPARQLTTQVISLTQLGLAPRNLIHQAAEAQEQDVHHFADAPAT